MELLCSAIQSGEGCPKFDKPIVKCSHAKPHEYDEDNEDCLKEDCRGFFCVEYVGMCKKCHHSPEYCSCS